MIRMTLIAAVAAVALAVPGLALAQAAQTGSAAEARAMLDKAGAAIRADKAEGGGLRLTRRGLDAATLARLADAWRTKREQDRAALEGMVDYAQGGRCRWRMAANAGSPYTPATCSASRTRLGPRTSSSASLRI